MIRIDNALDDPDRNGIHPVPIPELYRWGDIHAGLRLRIRTPAGERIGTVLEYSSNSWIARIKMEDE